MKPTIPAIERRFNPGTVEVRAEGETKKVRGYAAMFGKWSENLGTEKNRFLEVIERGAFDAALNDDIRALFNHDPNLILARSKGGNGTLKVGADETGLWYEFELPETQAGRDLGVSLSRGDVDQSSFGFTLTSEGESWDKSEDNGVVTYKRTIKRVARLYDVSPVTYPAYPDTEVALRSLEAFAQKPSEAQPAKDSNPVAEDTRATWLRIIIK
jgi:uncharacterized protein